MEWFLEQDAYFFHNGTHYELFCKLGAHPARKDGDEGVYFAVWAPHAVSVSVIGDFNGFDPGKDPMRRSGDSGVFVRFVKGARAGDRYLYGVLGADGSYTEKADPFAFGASLRPAVTSVVCDLSSYTWGDAEYIAKRDRENYLSSPMAVYEVHLGSFMKKKENGEDGFADYRTLAVSIRDHVLRTGYTHVELMGICEYPYDPSWGYQVTGYFSPTARYGTPREFMEMVDIFHRAGIGVILDWVPAHFPKDKHGLYRFDGTPLYEYADPLRAEYPEWGTLAFDLGRYEVSNFLIASALFFLTEYHIDALRVDAVAAMLYNDFSRAEWRPNKDGGNLNYESAAFFRHLNSIVETRTGRFLIAEDSSGIPGITRHVTAGGLGFGLKWNMGFMNDTLRYMTADPLYRYYHHAEMAHIADYAFSEHYILSLSHDEVVYGKKSLLGKMPGNRMDSFGALLSYYTFFIGFPGKKLLFMGQDVGETAEWDYRGSLDFTLAEKNGHKQLYDGFRALLGLYRRYSVLHKDESEDSFVFLVRDDREHGVFAFLRRDPAGKEHDLLFITSFTPTEHSAYTLGVPRSGAYTRVFTTTGDGTPFAVKAEHTEHGGYENRLTLPLRPYEAGVFECPADDAGN